MCSRCAHSRMWFVAPGRASPPNLGPILANLRQVAKVRRNLARTDGVRVGCQGERGTSADSLSKQALAPTSPTSRQCTQSWKGWLYLTWYSSHNRSTRHWCKNLDCCPVQYHSLNDLSLHQCHSQICLELSTVSHSDKITIYHITIVAPVFVFLPIWW